MGTLGNVNQFAYGCDQLINGLRCKRGFVACGANPGVDIGNADCDAFFAVFKVGRAPFFLDVMFATDRNKFGWRAFALPCLQKRYRLSTEGG